MRDSEPMRNLAENLRRSSMVRFLDHFSRLFPDSHMKDLVADDLGADRSMTVGGHRVMNFGSDSFLGLDQHPKVIEAIARGVRRTWGTHNGSSRAFSSVSANIEAEDRLAGWMKTEAGADLSVGDAGEPGGLAGAFRAERPAGGGRACAQFDPGGGEARGGGGGEARDVRELRSDFAGPGASGRGQVRGAAVAIDGVFSMSGALPPFAELNEVARRHRRGSICGQRARHGDAGREGSRDGSRRARRL